jgi:hypothetical protein
MPGQKISTMTLVRELQDNDSFPIARNGSTYRISGASLASRTQLLNLSAYVTSTLATTSSIELLNLQVASLSSTSLKIPAGGQQGDVLVYDTYTETWVASAAPSGLPKTNAKHGDTLVYNSITQAWMASSVSFQNEKLYEGDGAPIGSVMYYATSTIPAGWLECAGQSLHKDTYIDLWNVIGYAFGYEAQGSFFRLPDLRGEFIRGWDHDKGVDDHRTFGTFQKGSVAGDTSRIVLSGVPLLSAKKVLGFDDDTGNDYTGITLPLLSSASYNIIMLDEEEQTNLPVLSAVIGVSRPRNVALMPCIKYAHYKGLTTVGLSAQHLINTILSLSAYSIGVNQTWQELSATRLCNVTYTNTTMKPIAVNVYYNPAVAPLIGPCSVTLSLSGKNQTTIYGTYAYGGFSSSNLYFIVPPWWEYKVTTFENKFDSWVELR